ncbi:hypothetical protein CU669_08025 [Paramagnetospirillum kuznetsovii]|uniref:Uncharacterized protein n=1 Tax=Paramagnetospirillum kuznetsovii TaxID=2053833 RepID=A0A364NZV1_9PROT|nr:hypothetical protein [Paramagnetospirillum kuznetsovii]RAU22618.1 hypothetical protein CU669_08025 [Paramagnetospirillum kuznetsovii]
MAKGTDLDEDDKIRVLKALAFRIHRKLPADEAMAEVLDQESKGGRNRAFRPAKEALDADGFLAAMLAVGLLGEEAASVMAVVVDAHDHRLLSSALTKLAEHLESLL